MTCSHKIIYHIQPDQAYSSLTPGSEQQHLCLLVSVSLAELFGSDFHEGYQLGRRPSERFTEGRSASELTQVAVAKVQFLASCCIESHMHFSIKYFINKTTYFIRVRKK